MSLSLSLRSKPARLLFLTVIFTFLLYNYSSYFTSSDIFIPGGLSRSTCPPSSWNEGQWTDEPHTNLTRMTRKEEALEFAGFQGCASDREFFWHLASETESQWGKWPGVASRKWTPDDKGCDNVRPLDGASFVRYLAEQGGWLLLGDSITEGHFFSLSCILYPYVRATPNYTENPYFDRAWPQNLYLNPTSPLLHTLKLPRGFSIENTPLVTFRRVDLLLNKSELVDLYTKLYPRKPSSGDNGDESPKELFSEEAFWSLSPTYYMPLFTAPLPSANYATLIVSTAGHWTTTLLHAFRDESKKDEGYGIDGVLAFFKEAMKKWSGDVQAWLNKRNARVNGSGVKRQIIVRAYLPGHEDCHTYSEPWTYWHPYQWNWYNWAQIKDFNAIFKGVIEGSESGSTSMSSGWFGSPKREHPNIHYVGIDQPGLLRPDAHASSDCLHIMTGSGVMEGWTQYIWHFITNELPRQR